MRLAVRIGEGVVDQGCPTVQLPLRAGRLGAALGLQALIGDVQGREDRQGQRVGGPRRSGDVTHLAVDFAGQLVQVLGVAVPPKVVRLYEQEQKHYRRLELSKHTIGRRIWETLPTPY